MTTISLLFIAVHLFQQTILALKTSPQIHFAVLFKTTLVDVQVIHSLTGSIVRAAQQDMSLMPRRMDVYRRLLLLLIQLIVETGMWILENNVTVM